MSVKLGRLLSPNEQGDHIDEDRTNDDISNLQILTAEENRIKSERYRRLLKEKGGVYFDFNCPLCGAPKRILAKNYLARMETGTPPTCSKSCSAKLQLSLGKSAFKMLNIARSKIFRYRKENGIA
ncbi:hypothetical protein ACTFIT_009739 [Dictyostelium discoideum]